MGTPFIVSATHSLLVSGAYTVPEAPERVKTGFRQLLLLAQDLGEYRACREMRKQFCAYTKSMPRGALLRNQLVHAETIAAYRKLLLQFGEFECIRAT
jgi:tRNA-dihydrouridine synthase